MSPRSDYNAFFAAQAAALGADAQRRVRRASVAVVGCGGVGSAAAVGLAEAGIGKITLIDGQDVTPDNFNRLPFISRADVGTPKVQVVRRWLAERPHLNINAIAAPVEDASAVRAMANADLVLSASNTVSSRLLTARHTYLRRQPHVGAGVSDARESLAGNLSAWHPTYPELACHACLLDDSARSGEDVLVGSVTSMAGVLAAHLAISLLANPKPFEGDVPNALFFDLKTYVLEGIRVRRRKDCPVCASPTTDGGIRHP